jgi:carboxypeptidase Taq
MNPEKAYQELVRLSREEALLASALGLLTWDEEIYMPRGGVKHRAEQGALLAGLIHERAADPRYDELLSTVEASSLTADPESAEAVNVRELRRRYDRERKMPRDLVEEAARVRAHASQAWVEARQNDDFKSFAPWLDRVFAVARQQADALGYPESRYDALLEDYEPGATTEQLSALFAELEPQLVELVNSFADKTPASPEDTLEREFPLDRQETFAEGVAAALGYDLDCGRFDIAQHPFCAAIGPGDVRIGVRYNPTSFGRGFFAMVHETGHALYDQGLDAAYYGTPLGDPASLGVHESQSRLWENFVGRSNGFWQFFYPRLQGEFPEALRDVSVDDFRRRVNRISRSLIRIQADEVTYNLHIIIRFELELALLREELRAEDVPGAWSELYRRRLGIAPPDDRTGCLQDGHWSQALIAYFPTYTLGNIYAAQLFRAADQSIGPLDDAFARGDFRTLREWLRENVHRHGKRYLAPELIERVTGKPLTPSALIESLRNRYQQ